MNRPACGGPRAFTLVEIVLVVGILVALSAVAVPNLLGRIKRDELPRSARNLRSLTTLTRAHAAFDGKRYQIRFPREDELDPLGGDRQPLVEREDDPLEAPDEFHLVTASWAVGKTLLGDVWCVEVRMGRPTAQSIRDRRERTAEKVKDSLNRFDQASKEYELERLPLEIEPDGTSEWVTFILTTAPRDVELSNLQDYEQVDLIVDGLSGLAWLQRPFYDEELNLFEEKNWPVVLRQDFLDSRVLTENDVLELREAQIRGHDVKLKGRKLETATKSGKPSNSQAPAKPKTGP